MSYNGSGTFQINSSGQPVITGTVISSTAFNALTADLATGLSTAITKDGQTTTSARILFAQGISSTLTTDATSTTTGSIITAGGISCQKAAVVGTLLGVGMAPVNVLDITQTQDAASNISLRNSSTGTSASSRVYLGNSVSATSGRLITWGSGFTSTGVYRQDGLLLEGVGAGGVTISANAAQPIYFATNGGERMRIDSTGLVGIGTTPACTLNIYGANTASRGQFSIDSSGTDSRLTWYTSGTFRAALNVTSTAISFDPQNNQSYIFPGTGVIIAGRSTAVTPSGTTIRGCFASGVSATNGTNSVCVGSNTITFDDSFLFVNNAAGVGVYLANGGTTWTANSDREMKHKIEALNAHDILRAVGDEAAKNGESIAVLYDWKENSDRREAGSIAQNWLVALPAIVEASNPEKLGLMYDRMGAIAAQGVYEQLAINAALEARLAALESK